MNSVHDFSSGVIFKLMSFTFAMITLPIGTYFFTNAYVFNGMPGHLVSQLDPNHLQMVNPSNRD